MKAIITGASKGIGFAIAQKFVSQQVDVIICARNETALLQAKKLLQESQPSVSIHHYAADLSDITQAKAFALFCTQTFATIDILVNNAGSFVPGNILSEPDEHVLQMLQTNLLSAYYVTKIIAPGMQVQRKGHIINMCSVAGLQAYPNGGSYSISKFALHGFSANLRRELMPYGVKVTALHPGATMSDSWAGSGIDEQRIMQSKDIAEVVWNVCQLSPQAVVEDVILRPQLGDL